MTYSTDSLERFVTTVRTDLKTWPQLLPFRQRVPAGRLSRDFVVAFFVSVVIHAAFLALLLWVLATDRIAVEPTAPSIGTPLIVSLSTLATTSHDGLDREAVSAMPHTGPPTQRSQSSPERSRSAERKSEAETVVTSKGQGIQGSGAPEGKSLNATPSIDLEHPYRMARDFGRMPEFKAETVVTSKGQGIQGSEAPEGKSLATDATPSIDLEAAYRMAWDLRRMPEFKAETFVTSIGQGVPGSEAPEGKSLATNAIPSIDLEAVFRIAREGSWMSESEVRNQRFKWRIRYIKNYEASLPPDCRTYYAQMGLLAIPLLIRDTITDSDSGCKW